MRNAAALEEPSRWERSRSAGGAKTDSWSGNTLPRWWAVSSRRATYSMGPSVGRVCLFRLVRQVGPGSRSTPHAMPADDDAREHARQRETLQERLARVAAASG